MPDPHWKIELIDKALATLSPLESPCIICPRQCGADRSGGGHGICRTGNSASVSHSLLHFGEEPALSGSPAPLAGSGNVPGRGAGSGTIFFSGCNLKCLFCQNFQISWFPGGKEVSDEGLAGMMLDLESKGALNINLVSPTHVVVPILRALRKAFELGLTRPLVYNSNGYENVEVIRALEGIVDIYLPDLKYLSGDLSSNFSAAPDYFERAAEAVREMSLQQPVLRFDGNGIARRGLVLRHLVLPGCVEDSLSILRWARENLSPHIALSLMSQYQPCFRSPREIARPLGEKEYARATEEAFRLGFETLYLQPKPFAPDEHLLPDFRRKDPFRWMAK